MASHIYASNQLPINDQFELVANETIPLEQPAANRGFSAAPTMNITRSMKVNTGDAINVEHFISVNQRYFVPLDSSQMTVQLPYGYIHPFRSACGSSEQQMPLGSTTGDLRIQNVFNNQSCFNGTTIFRSPAAEALMKEINIKNSSRGTLDQSYQQYAGCSLPPVSFQPISAPSNHLEPKELLTKQTENPFLKVNGGITNSLNKDMNGRSDREATNGPTDLSGVVSRKNFDLNIKIPGSDSPLHTTTFTGSLSNSSPDSPLLVLKKELSNSDVASLGRIVLPKREAETHFPNLDDNKMTLIMEMDDLQSDITWEFKFRFWPNNKSRMYVLEHTGEFVRTHKLRVGDILMIFKDKGNDKYTTLGKRHPRNVGGSRKMVSHGKNESARNPGIRLKHGKRRTVTQNMLPPFAGEKTPLSNPTETGARHINQVAFPPLFFAAPSFVRHEDFNKLIP